MKKNVRVAQELVSVALILTAKRVVAINEKEAQGDFITHSEMDVFGKEMISRVASMWKP